MQAEAGRRLFCGGKWCWVKVRVCVSWQVWEHPVRGLIALDEAIYFDSERGIQPAPSGTTFGYVFQDTPCFPHLNVYENVAFGSKHRACQGS